MWIIAALICLLPQLAWGQAAVRQSGTVSQYDIMRWRQTNIADSPAADVVSGRGVNPFSIYDQRSGGLTVNDALTTGPYRSFIMGHDSDGNALLTVSSFAGATQKGLKVDINGTVYDFPGAGTGNVIGPVPPTIVGELVSFNSTGGTAIRQGAATLTDNKAAAFTTDAASLSVFSNTGTTAYHVWSCTIGLCDSGASTGNYDGIRSVVVSASGQTADLASAFAGYLINSQPRAGPPYSSFPTSAVINGIGICDADGCGTWGINTIVADNRGQTVSAHGPRFIVGGEFDVQVTSVNTTVNGVLTGGSSKAQPLGAIGYSCLYLDNPSNGAVAKWTSCLSSQHGSAVAFAQIGAAAASGSSISSQSLNFYFYDSGAVLRNTSLAQTPGGMLLATNGADVSGSFVIPAGAVFGTGDNGGLQINTRTTIFGAGATLGVGSDVNWTTINFGNASAATAVFGTDVTLVPTAGNAVIIGQRLKVPVMAVASLVTCNAGAQGSVVMVTDANSAVFNDPIAAGGANIVLAVCDGAAWKVH